MSKSLLQYRKEELSQLKSDLKSILDERKPIEKKVNKYTLELENPDSVMTKAGINKKISKYTTILDELKTRREDLIKKIKDLKSLIKKAKGPTFGARSCFAPLLVREKFADLMGISKDTIMSYPFANKKIFEYIKENNLFDKNTKKYKLDESLKDLFDVEDDLELSFHDMHKYIVSKCLIKEDFVL